MNHECSILNIVCFGDSLTLGYQSPTPRDPFAESIPYGHYLQEWLGKRGRVMVKGVCGETTQDMRVRFHQDVLAHVPQIVIILGGTNDLGCGMRPEAILENLRFLYGQAQAQHILPVAVTVPSLRVEYGQDHDGPGGSAITAFMQEAIDLRLAINQDIIKLGQVCRFPVVDWFAETGDPKTYELISAYSNDGLHLNTIGYKKLAEMIWEQVLAGLVKQ